METFPRSADDFLWSQRLSVRQMIDVLSKNLNSTEYYVLGLVVLGLDPLELNNALKHKQYVRWEAKIRFLMERMDEKPDANDLQSFAQHLVKDLPCIKWSHDVRDEAITVASIAKFALNTHIPDVLLPDLHQSTQPTLEEAAKAYFTLWRDKLGEKATSKTLYKLLRDNKDIIETEHACKALEKNIECAVNQNITKKQASVVCDVLPEAPPFWKILAQKCYNYTKEKQEKIMYGKHLKDIVAERLAVACEMEQIELWRVGERLEAAKRDGIIHEDVADYFLELDEQEMERIPAVAQVGPIAMKLSLENWKEFISKKLCKQEECKHLANLVERDPKECLISLLTSNDHQVTLESLYQDLLKLRSDGNAQLTEQCLIAALSVLTEDFCSDYHTEMHIKQRENVSNTLHLYYEDTFKTFNPFSWQHSTEFRMNDMYTPLKAISLTGHTDTIDRHTIEMNSLFQRHTLSRQYMIVGDAGSGKTAFCRKLAYEWARSKDHADKPLGAFKFIFLIFIRHLNNQDLIDYISKAYKASWASSGVKEHELKEILRCKICAKEMLFIIDGYDEENTTNFKESILYKLLRGQYGYFMEATKIVTTRPNGVNNIQNLFTKGFMIVDFESPQIEQFIEKYKQLCPSFKRPDIKNHPQKHLLGKPLFLWMFCIYHSIEDTKEETLSSWSAFFRVVMLHMIKKAKERIPNESPSASATKLINAITQRITSSIDPAKISLAEILQMAHIDKNDTKVIDDLKSFATRSYKDSNAEKILAELSEYAFHCSCYGRVQFECDNMSTFVEELGLVNKLGSTNSGSIMYEFVYNSILEYLSAHYIVERFDDFTNNLQQIPEVRDAAQSDSLILWFVCGRLAEKLNEPNNDANQRLTEVFEKFVFKYLHQQDHGHHFLYRSAYETRGNIGSCQLPQLPYYHVNLDFCTQYCFLGYISLASKQKGKIQIRIENLDELIKLFGSKGWSQAVQRQLHVAELAAFNCRCENDEVDMDISGFSITEELCMMDCDGATTNALLDNAENKLLQLCITWGYVEQDLVSNLVRFQHIKKFVFTHNNMPFDGQFFALPLLQVVQDLAVSITDSCIIPPLLVLPQLRKLSVDVNQSHTALYEGVIEKLMSEESCIRHVTLPDGADVVWFDVAVKLNKTVKYKVDFNLCNDAINIFTKNLQV